MRGAQRGRWTGGNGCVCDSATAKGGSCCVDTVTWNQTLTPPFAAGSAVVGLSDGWAGRSATPRNLRRCISASTTAHSPQPRYVHPSMHPSIPPPSIPPHPSPPHPSPPHLLLVDLVHVHLELLPHLLLERVLVPLLRLLWESGRAHTQRRVGFLRVWRKAPAATPPTWAPARCCHCCAPLASRHCHSPCGRHTALG